MSRPTTAQVAVVSDLHAISTDAESATGIAINLADLDQLHEIITSTRALIPLVDRDEQWIEPALAHVALCAALIAAVKRRGEER